MGPKVKFPDIFHLLSNSLILPWELAFFFKFPDFSKMFPVYVNPELLNISKRSYIKHDWVAGIFYELLMALYFFKNK